MRFIVLAMLLATGIASAADTPFNDAAQIFMRAQQGQEKDVEPAIAAFEALARAEPGNPVYASYLGSAITLKGRDALMPWNRVKYVEEGLDRLDGALAALKPEQDKELLNGVPAGMLARLVAANTFLRLPDGIFHRRAQGKKLVADLLKNPALAGAPANFRAAVDKAAAEAARP